MSDSTEGMRRLLMGMINHDPQDREALEREYGQVWDTDQFIADFEAEAFLAPFVIVRKRSTGERGSLAFQHHPRYYFSFAPATRP